MGTVDTWAPKNGKTPFFSIPRGNESVTKSTGGPRRVKHADNRSRGQIKRREKEKSSVRAKVEHVFGVVKGQLRYRKTRYRGLRKQIAKLEYPVRAGESDSG